MKMTKITVDIPMTLEIQGADIDNILATCFEGGSNYWIDKVQVVDKDYKGCQYASDVVSQGGELIIIIDDDQLTLTKNKLIKGIQKWYEKYHYPRHKEIQGEFHLFDWDANDSDLIIQYALFSEIVYG